MADVALHMSDIHLTTPGSTIGGRDPKCQFRTRAHTHPARSQRSGAAGHHGRSLRLGRSWRLHQIEGAARAVTNAHAGLHRNHDDRAAFLEVFPECRDAGGFAQGYADTSVARCLFLDTWGPQTHAGHYCSMRQTWLDDQLAAHDGRFLIFMHHNPIPTHLGPMDQIRLLDDEAFRAIIARHASKVRHIFFGHCHLPISGSTAGVPTTSLRGTNHAAIAVFSEAKLLSRSNLPESYGVAFVGRDYLTVHMVEFGYDGPIEIEGSPDYAAWNRETMAR